MKKKTPAPRKEIKLDKYQLRQYLLKDIPVCEDMEKSVLSTCLVENDKIEQISRQLKPSWFYCSNNREIFASIRMLSRFGSEVNVLTVAKEVQESFGKDVSNYLSEIFTFYKNPEHLSYYIAIISQYAILREIKMFATKYSIFDPYIDCEDLYIRFQQDFKDLQSRMSLKKAPAASFHLMKLGDSLNFGKFRGFTIEQVLLTEGGLEYLEWLDDNVPGVYIDWKDVAKWKSNHIRIKYSTDSEETDYFNDFSKIIINK